MITLQEAHEDYDNRYYVIHWEDNGEGALYVFCPACEEVYVDTENLSALQECSNCDAQIVLITKSNGSEPNEYLRVSGREEPCTGKLVMTCPYCRQEAWEGSRWFESDSFTCRICRKEFLIIVPPRMEAIADEMGITALPPPKPTRIGGPTNNI